MKCAKCVECAFDEAHCLWFDRNLRAWIQYHAAQSESLKTGPFHASYRCDVLLLCHLFVIGRDTHHRALQILFYVISFFV